MKRGGVHDLPNVSYLTKGQAIRQEGGGEAVRRLGPGRGKLQVEGLHEAERGPRPRPPLQTRVNVRPALDGKREGAAVAWVGLSALAAHMERHSDAEFTPSQRKEGAMLHRHGRKEFGWKEA